MLRVFTFSSDLFGGFTVLVNLKEYNSIPDIEDYCTAKLMQKLYKNNFVELVAKACQKTFHIHNATSMKQIIDASPNTVFYICDCDSIK